MCISLACKAYKDDDLTWNMIDTFFWASFFFVNSLYYMNNKYNMCTVKHDSKSNLKYTHLYVVL
jgi:hypothetical protein